MMAALGEYIFSVAATVLVCGIVNTMLGNTAFIKLVKFIGGLIVLLSVVRPLYQYTWPMDISLPDIPFGQWEDIPFQGKDSYHNALGEIIKQKTEAYILDKASDMGLSVTVEVSVSKEETPVPESVRISGSVSPYGKLQLEEMIQKDLNISKENQFWTG